MNAETSFDDVSRETLERFTELVLLWNDRINLIAPGDRAAIWDRHIRDAVRLADAVPTTARTWADLGTGGGFPGIPLSIVLSDISFTLVEADARKVAFLRAARRQLQLQFEIIHGRIEEVEPLGMAVISARALAPLPTLLGYCVRHAAPDATFILPKGRSWAEEVDLARQTWEFDLSIRGPQDGPVLILTNVRQRTEDHADH